MTYRGAQNLIKRVMNRLFEQRSMPALTPTSPTRMGGRS